ncbi:MAG TPA: chemotaxis protein CheA [Anaeromyxobacteraceae bacterium]|jgi:two-component system chemotaxis sensor kinase CheA|nr:chemotaxis protein CheA [Anaeromyxobacteraceae bacterium]
MAERPSEKALSEFISEAQENIEALDRDFLRLEDACKGRGSEDADPDILNAVFRAAHTLKGVCAMFGVERMARLAHALEDLLDAVRMGRRGLDGSTFRLVNQATDLLGKCIAEEADGKPPATGEAAEALAQALRAKPATAAAGGDDPLDALLDPAVLSVLTEYEEHRLRFNLGKGQDLFRVKVNFDLASFDTALDVLKARLKELGEVVSTLPSSDASDPNAIAFDLLFCSAAGRERVTSAAGPAAAVEQVPRGHHLGAPRHAAHAPGLSPLGGSTPPAEAPATLPLAGADPMGSPAADEPAQLHREPAAGAAPGGEAETSSLRSVSQAVRVDIHKLDRLMNVVGELVLVKTSLLQLAERMRGGEDHATLSAELHRESRSLERKLNDLQTGILEVRMVPLGQVFDKLSRMVRKLTRDLGKEIEFTTEGGDTELDKLIVEDLSDPLMHLIRNSLDHAIEAPELRRQRGKPRAGLISLRAAQKGSHVQITVEDDGNGIDDARIREVAVKRGLVSQEQVAQMGRREVMNLIFLPGFSTARQVTSLSGRGVGMDVVKNNIANLSGIIDLHTELGRGTRFEITLPVTLAIIRALVVSAAQRTYAVPLSSVLEILTVDPAELRTIETREVITLRGATLPLVRLARFFGTRAEEPRQKNLHVVVVGLAQERLGIAVDELTGQQDVVVKPLGRALGTIRGLAGATDLGNRRTVLVLDVGAIIEEVVRGEGPREPVGQAG